MLTENEDEEKGGTIVLVTDGKSSPGYLTIADVEQDIIKAGIRIISVAFGFVYSNYPIRKIDKLMTRSVTGTKRTRTLSTLPT